MPSSNFVQRTLCDLNADKTKLMVLSKAKSKPLNLPSITTLQGSEINSVSQYNYILEL